ncbi:MAG: ribosome assembly RNA-binding protein YhbY [Firmicutes bacterium]|nr:ribosome assembly RNA-binding protein YhbY [Bacillota bacterium]
MELTGKQKRFLRSLVVTEEAIVHIGKSGLTENLVQSAQQALQARELIKVKILNNNEDDKKLVAQALAEATDSSIVQVIGRNFVLYKRNPEEPKIILP